MLKLRSFFFITLLLAAATASAQFSFGVKAGLNLSSYSDMEGLESKIGYKIGPAAEYSLGDKLGIQAALLLSSKGAKAKEGNAKIDANYLELPITAVYKFSIAPDTKLYVNAGPYFAYGIFGKIKGSEEVVDGVTVSVEVDTFGENGLKKFDAGITAGVGMEIMGINFGLNYDLGLTKVMEEGDASNRNFWISVGYYF
ncbi:MAG: PorT family protein [Bacteroidales bacterium]|jgi:hypothetical protein|nr:PorT family protein [Bacteroidales bacterium]